MKMLILISLMTFLLNVILLAYLLKDRHSSIGFKGKERKEIRFQLRPQEEAVTEITETELLHQRQAWDEK